MKRSQLFTKTQKQHPADEPSKNAQLLSRAGFVYKEMAGAYTYLPLGLMVLENISSVVRQEMNAIGGQELKLTILQDPNLWQKTGRWDDETVDIWFKTELKAGGQLGLGMTHEEPLTNLLRNYISSYKDLPVMAYQIQTKLRNELRSKSGLMRGREFLMKDMYSFSADQAQHDQLYETIKATYSKVYGRLGIGEQTFLTFASGGMFSKYSHEFQTLIPAGEDTIFLDRSKKLAVNQEVLSDEILTELGLERAKLEEVKAAEVGNIFSLGSKFSEPLGLSFNTEDGQSKDVLMGCYGIGVSRSMGVIAELTSDELGLVWPAEIAPFKVYLARVGNDSGVVDVAEELYNHLTNAGIAVLYDDRSEARPGEMFADADLIGLPYRLIVSPKTIASGQHELKKRTVAESQHLDNDSLIKALEN